MLEALCEQVKYSTYPVRSVGRTLDYKDPFRSMVVSGVCHISHVKSEVGVGYRQFVPTPRPRCGYNQL